MLCNNLPLISVALEIEYLKISYDSAKKKPFLFSSEKKGQNYLRSKDMFASAFYFTIYARPFSLVET